MDTIRKQLKLKRNNPIRHHLKYGIVVGAVFLSLGAIPQASLKEAINQYWNAPTQTDKEKAIKYILEINPSFDGVYELLSQGKKYKSLKTGFIKIPQLDSQLPPNALVVVPEDYSPISKYPVQVYLHGAVSNMDPDFLYRYTVDTLSQQLLKSKSIMIFPTGWYLSPWWSELQFNNIKYLVSWVKAHYNVDENRIRLSGVSDGGIGSYYLANGDQTLWASLTPFIGSIRVLNKIGGREVYLNNFRNSNLMIVNTSKDQTFNIGLERPYIESLRQINKHASFIEVDSSGHSMGWYPVLKDTINNFVANNPREPYPDHLSWQTDNVLKYNRFRYLIIEKLGKTKASGSAKDTNNIRVHGKEEPAFGRSKSSGMVDLQKEGNVVRVNTSGVKRYKLLLSTQHFDFQEPIVIYTNDVKSYEGRVTPDVKTLLKWNLEDNDREMLFGAELSITVN